MANIPEYLRGKLASSRVGVPSIDTSGAEIASSVKRLADTFFVGFSALERERKAQLDQVEVNKLSTDFKLEYMNQKDSLIKNSKDPKSTEEQLNNLTKTLSEERLQTIQDAGLRQDATNIFSIAQDELRIEHAAWRIQRENQLALEDTFNQLQNSVLAMRTTTNLNDYLNTIKDINSKKEVLSPLLDGDFQKIDTLITNTVNETTTEFAYNLINEGQAKEAFRLLNSGAFNLLSEERFTKLETKITNALKGDKERATLTLSFNTVHEHAEVVEKLNTGEMTFVDLEETASKLAFELSKPDLPPEERRKIETKRRVYEALADIELSTLKSTSSDNASIADGLRAKALGILDRDEALEGTTLDDILELQAEATEEYAEGNLSWRTYRELVSDMTIASLSLFPEEAFKGRATDLIPPFFEPAFSDVAKENQEVFRDLNRRVRKLDDGDTAQLIEAYRMYKDEQSESGIALDKQARKDKLDEVVRRSYLKKKGLPTTLITGDVVNTPVGPKPIAGWADGEMVFEFTPEEMQQLQQLRIDNAPTNP